MFLRLVVASLLVLVLTGVENPRSVAAASRSTDRQLRQLMEESDPDKREALRKKLLKLDAAELRAAIAGLSFSAADERGATVQLDILCPDGFTRPHFLRVPESYDHKKNYPLVVLLHGGCLNAPPDWALGLLEAWESRLPAPWQEEVLILGIAACCRTTNRDAVWYCQGGLENIVSALTQVKLDFNVDDDRVFVSGFSDGGSGTFGLAYTRPDIFAGFLPMCGHPLVPSMLGCNTCMQNLKAENIFSISSGKDELYPADMVLDYLAMATAAGAQVETKVYPDGTHSFDSIGDDAVPLLLEKVSSWTRNLTPAAIDWTADSQKRGRRAWLSIDEIADLGKGNSARSPQPAAGRVNLGMLPVRPADPAAAATVDGVQASSTADKMGLRKGDLIFKVDEVEVKDYAQLAAQIAGKEWGGAIELTVKRDGKQLELTGEFAAYTPPAGKPLQARVLAELIEPGEVELSVWNASKLSVWVHEGMLSKDGKLVVKVNGKKVGTFKPEADAGVILSEFERTGDRKLPFIARIQIDAGKILK